MVTLAWDGPTVCTSMIRGLSRLLLCIEWWPSQWNEIPTVPAELGALAAEYAADTVIDYFEYNSTTNDSLMVDGRSERCGTALNTPFNPLASTSSHSGNPRCSAATAAPLMRSWFFAFSVTSTTSPCRSRKDGIFTRLPFTRMQLWRTTCRASERDSPKPILYTTVSSRLSKSCSRFSPVTLVPRLASL